MYLLALALTLADGNAISETDQTGSTQTGRPIYRHRIFARGEIANYPRPYVAGVAATFQTDNVNRWSDGSVQSADISWTETIGANATVKTDFRNDANPCTGASTVNGCRALGLTTSQALNFNAGAGAGQWDFKQEFTARPQGSSTAQTISVRTMLTDGNCYAWLSGPVHTQYVCGMMKTDGTMDTARTYALGFTPKRIVRLVASVGDADTSAQVSDATQWASIPRPFKVHMKTSASERMSVCYVDTGVTPHRIYFGLTNGSSSACGNVNGRGQDGTSAQVNNYNYGDKVYWDEEGLRLTADLLSNSTSFTINDASGITVPQVVQVEQEQILIVAKSSNTLTPGITGSTSYNGYGRYYAGTNIESGNGSIAWNSGSNVYLNINNWVDATSNQYKSLQPTFTVDFWTGWSGVGCEAHFWNNWSDRVQDQEFDWRLLKSPSNTVVVAKTKLRSVPFSSDKYPDGTTNALWRNEGMVWDGTAPGEVRTDYNLPYLRYSGMIPHDPAITATSGLVDRFLTVDQAVPAWGGCASPALEHGSHGAMAGWDSLTNQGSGSQTQCQAVGFDGFVYRGLPDPGARCDIGPINCWYSGSLYLMASSITSSSRWLEIFESAAQSSGHIPVQITETDTSSSRKYCGTGVAGSLKAGENTNACFGGSETVPAFGYPLSRSNRTGLNWVNPGVGSNDPGDIPTKVGAHTKNNWAAASQSDVKGHWPELPGFAYMLRGSWYQYWVMLHSAHYGYANASIPGCGAYVTSAFNRQFCGNSDWGVPVVYPNGNRLKAWTGRDYAIMAFIARPGSPEKQLFTRLTDIYLATTEGKFNVTTGTYYAPCAGSPTKDDSWWCHGKLLKGNNDPNFSIAAMSEYSTSVGGHSGTTDYMINYELTTLGWLGNLGFSTAGSVLGASRRITNQALNRSEWPQPYSISCYAQNSGPVIGDPNTIGATVSYASWTEAYADRYSGCNDSFQKNLQANDCQLTGGYAPMALAAFAINEGIWDSSKSWSINKAFDWTTANSRCRDNASLGGEPQWAFSRNRESKVSNIRVTALGTTTATIRFVRPPAAASCSYALNATDSATTGDTAITATPWALDLPLSLTGLTSATAYTARITCGLGRGTVTFTTN